jgi:hypothetical protein
VWYDGGHMEENLRDVLETVNFIKERMVTKDDLAAVEARLDLRIDKLDAKIGRIDLKLTKFEEAEIDKRLQLQVRVANIEKHLNLPAATRS